MTDHCQIVKDRVNIIEAAEMCGMRLDRHGKTLCPWHDDHHASLSFKNGHFRCFTCDAHGDVLDLVQKVTGCTLPEAIKWLNQAFHLGLDLDKPVRPADIDRLRRERERAERFKAWEHDAFITVNQFVWYLKDILSTKKPKHPDAPIDQQYIFAVHEWETANYLLDILTFGSWDEKTKLYKYYHKKVMRYEQFNTAVGRRGVS